MGQGCSFPLSASKQPRNFHGSSGSGPLMRKQCAACRRGRRSRRTNFCFVPPHGRQLGNAPLSGDDETSVATKRLFSELQDASWHRRYRAHLELMRRGKRIQGEVLSRLKKAAAGSPFQSSLIWLAAACGERKEVERLAVSTNDNARLNAIRALIQFGGPGEDCGLLEDSLRDPNPQIALAALIGV